MLTELEFESWEERIISEERGKRVVHYFLIDSSGNSVLAVEGTERSIRHMTYVVSDSFLHHYGSSSSSSISTPTKWRSRRELLHWLSTLVSTPPRFESSSSTNLVHPVNDRMRRFSGSLNSHSPLMLPRKLKAHISHIVWNGIGWTCSKQLMHYPSFTRTGVTFSVHSFVFIMAAEGNPYLGYLEDMYEDKKGQKRVKVRWFHRDDEVISLVSQLDAHPREVFITPHVQVINADCIDRPASVLTPKHYEQCVSVLPQSLLCRVHLCFRQFKDDHIRPFSISKLLGYRKQPVLSCIDHLLSSDNKTKRHNSGEDHHGNSMTRGDVKKGCKRKRFDEGRNGDAKVRVRKKPAINHNIQREETSPSAPGSQIAKPVLSYPKLKIKLSGKTLKYNKFGGDHHVISASFNIDDEIELLCQDSGIRGCWYKCKVLEISRKHLKVQYDDLEDADETGNLQEWVASCRVADPDGLGTRFPGRLTTRPRPPEDPGDCILEVGTAVDVWWCDGWWEGAVITTNVCGTDHLQIYLPDEDRYVTAEKSNVRTAKDWVNGSWVHAKARPDILSCISAKSNSRLSDCVMPPISEAVEVEEDGKDIPVAAMYDSVTGIGDNTTCGSYLKKDNFDVENDEQHVEDFVGCDMGHVAEDDKLGTGMGKDFVFGWPLKSVEASVR